LPVHWELRRLKYLGEAITGLTYSPDHVVDEGEGTLVLRSSNVQGGKVVFDDNVYVSMVIDLKLITRMGDIIICSRNGSRALIGKNATIDKLSENQTFGAFMTVFRSKHSAYVSCVLNSPLFEFQSGAFMTSTINQLTLGTLNNFEVPWPPAEERAAIVAFLDRETAKIDRLMAVRQKQVERLQEQRTAVIHHAVTKGIDPHARMKPSGVEWLGDVPEGWQIHRLRRTTSRETNGFWGEEPVGDCSDITCIRVADFDRYKRRIKVGSKTLRSVPNSKRFNRLLKLGDLLLEKSGGGEQTPVGCVVLYDYDELAITSNFIAKLSPLSNFDSSYLCYLHQVLYDIGITRLSVKQTTGIQNIDSFWYLNELAPFPPKSVQQSITEFLDRETAKLDTLMAKYRRELDLLAEYRASLISHAVTGKIDVRGLVEAIQ
jgi:type I restriction enzyme S subunit